MTKQNWVEVTMKFKVPAIDMKEAVDELEADVEGLGTDFSYEAKDCEAP